MVDCCLLLIDHDFVVPPAMVVNDAAQIIYAMLTASAGVVDYLIQRDPLAPNNNVINV